MKGRAAPIIRSSYQSILILLFFCSFFFIFFLNYVFRGFINFYIDIYLILFFYLIIFLIFQKSWKQYIQTKRFYKKLVSVLMLVFGFLLTAYVIAQILIQSGLFPYYRTYLDFLSFSTIVVGWLYFWLLPPSQHNSQNNEILSKVKARGIRKILQTKNIYILLLCLICLLGLYLRIKNLDNSFPFRDEYYHLNAAKRFMIEGRFNYPRSQFLSYLIGFLFKFNNHTPTLFIARFPGVVVGTASIICTYYLGKKINTTIGVLSAALYAILPFAIGMSRFVREYQYFFLVLQLYFLFSFTFWDWILNKKLNLLKTFFSVVVFVFPLIYYITIDNSLIIVQLYTLLILSSLIQLFFYFYKLILVEKAEVRRLFKSRKVTFTVLIAFVICSSLLFAFVKGPGQWLLGRDGIISFNIPSINYFDSLFNPSFTPWGQRHMWYTGIELPKMLPVFFFILPIIWMWKNKYFLFYFLSFWIILFLFLFVFDQYYQSRYIYYTIIFLPIVYASSIYCLFNIIKRVKPKIIQYFCIIAVTALCITVFSPINTIKGVTAELTSSMIDTKTELSHYNVRELLTFLYQNNFSEKDTLISADDDIFAFYLDGYRYINNKEEFPLQRLDSKSKFAYENNKFRYDYTNIYIYHYAKPYYLSQCFDSLCNLKESELVALIINSHDKGWIVMDKDRNRNWNPEGFPLKDFRINNSIVRYIGSTSGYRGFDVYKWENTY